MRRWNPNVSTALIVAAMLGGELPIKPRADDPESKQDLTPQDVERLRLAEEKRKKRAMKRLGRK